MRSYLKNRELSFIIHDCVTSKSLVNTLMLVGELNGVVK